MTLIVNWKLLNVQNLNEATLVFLNMAKSPVQSVKISGSVSSDICIRLFLTVYPSINFVH